MAVLLTTSLGIVVVVLKDAGRLETPLGQVTLLGALLGDFTSVALISVLFVGAGRSLGATLIGLAVFCVAGTVLALALVRCSAIRGLRRAVDQRAGGASQLGVRLSFAVMVGFAALGEVFGLDAILGAFIAGVAVSAVSDRAAGTGATRDKLGVVGFGVLAPVFFVTAGLRLDLGALADSAADLVLVPVLLVAMIATRALPTLLFAGLLTRPELLVSALLLSTKLTFVVAVVQVASDNAALRPATASALVTAAVLTVIVLPTTAAWMLRLQPDRGTGHRAAGNSAA